MCWAWALPVGHREILSYSLFVHFNKDVCKGFVYFCLSGLNHRQWKYSFNLICRLLKLNGGCLFYCTTNKYVCIYGLSIFCLFSFSWHIVLQLLQDFYLIMISSLTLEPLTWHLKRIIHIRAAPLGSFCFLLLPSSECFSERKNTKLFMKTLYLFLALE